MSFRRQLKTQCFDKRRFARSRWSSNAQTKGREWVGVGGGGGAGASGGGGGGGSTRSKTSLIKDMVNQQLCLLLMRRQLTFHQSNGPCQGHSIALQETIGQFGVAWGQCGETGVKRGQATMAGELGCAAQYLVEHQLVFLLYKFRGGQGVGVGWWCTIVSYRSVSGWTEPKKLEDTML